MAAFKLWKLEILWKSNVDQTVRIRNNNVDHSGLIHIPNSASDGLIFHAGIKVSLLQPFLFQGT
jgi:hypothetical protein